MVVLDGVRTAVAIINIQTVQIEKPRVSGEMITCVLMEQSSNHHHHQWVVAHQ